MNPLSKQAGYTATAMIIMLAVGGIITAGAARYSISATAEYSGAALGTMLAQVNKAVGTYTVNNYAALVNGSGNLAPTIADLQNAGLLNANIGTPPIGGAYAIQISREPVGCVSPNCNLTSRVWFTQPITNANTGHIDIRKLGAATAALGGDSGWSDNINPSTVRGIGGWTRANPAGDQAGILMAINGYGSSSFSQYVDRAGQQGMQADFKMSGNNITGANGINANSVTLPGGQGLHIGGVNVYGDSLNSAIRVPAGGGVFLERQDGTPAHIGSVGNINSTGQVNGAYIVSTGNMAAQGSLAAQGNVTAAGAVQGSNVTSSGETYTNGYFRTNGDGGWYSQKWNGGFYMSDGAWVRSYADKSMYTGGQMQAGSLQSNSSLTVAGNATIAGNSTVGSQVVAGNSSVGGMLVVGGDQTVVGSAAVTRGITPGQIASEGSSCSGNAGAIARDANNNLYICN